MITKIELDEKDLREILAKYYEVDVRNVDVTTRTEPIEVMEWLYFKDKKYPTWRD